jgi:hypothetical protein
MEAVSSKAQRIRELLAQGGKTTREIACIVFCTEKPTEANLSYVRVSGRQRTLGNGMSQHDLNWRIKKFGSHKAYYDQINAKTRESRNAYYRDRWREDADYRAAKVVARRNLRHKKRLEAAHESV